MAIVSRSLDCRRTGDIVVGFVARRHLERPYLLLRQRRHSQETTIAPKDPGKACRIDSCLTGLEP